MEIISITIATVALIASIYSVFESRKNNILTHEPYIVAHEIEGDTEYVYQITNKGGGPAFFEKVDYYFNLEKLDGDNFRGSVNKILNENGIRYKSTIMKFGNETIMAPGETFDIIKINIHSEDKEKMGLLPNAVYGVKIIYKSAHGKSKSWFNDERIKLI